MRAVFLRNDLIPFESQEIYCLNDDRAKHLVKVARIKEGEKVLVLDGQGTFYHCRVVELDKNKVFLECHKIEKKERNFRLDVALGVPKKEAFEHACRNSCELGVRKIIPFFSEYSQIKTLPKKERLQGILESATIQSNNPFLLDIDNNFSSFEKIKEVAITYDNIFLASVFDERVSRDLNMEGLSFNRSNNLLLVGPEGGFSKREEGELALLSCHVKKVSLPTSILRTPNAISACVGFLLGKFESK